MVGNFSSVAVNFTEASACIDTQATHGCMKMYACYSLLMSMRALGWWDLLRSFCGNTRCGCRHKG